VLHLLVAAFYAALSFFVAPQHAATHPALRDTAGSVHASFGAGSGVRQDDGNNGGGPGE
jgi:hypothetical protein